MDLDRHPRPDPEALDVVLGSVRAVTGGGVPATEADTPLTDLGLDTEDIARVIGHLYLESAAATSPWTLGKLAELSTELHSPARVAVARRTDRRVEDLSMQDQLVLAELDQITRERACHKGDGA